ncbi:MAG: hypothetical protein V4700_06520 [Pseudomonadota bacterium]
MFNLNEAIRFFNRTHHTKIKQNKTWRLVYLQPTALAFLNNSVQLIRESVYYSSYFVTHRKTLRSTLARIKEPTTKALPMLRTIVQKLKIDQSILQRLKWEERLNVFLNEDTSWKQGLKHTKNNPPLKRRLIQFYQQWKIHQPFQYYSSQGLLFLLDVVVKYQLHFTQAHKELEDKQLAYFHFLRLPDPIAKDYYQFLFTQLNHLKVLHDQVLEALLLRLKIAEQQNQITCDDVSYALAQQTQRLGLPLPVASLPKYQMILDTSTFNTIHRAIEKYGNTNQKKQLYQLVWYQEEFSSIENITIITVSSHRLLIPKALIDFRPKRVGKLTWLFTKNTRLQFLETQQALLAQFALPLDFAGLPPETVSITHPTLQSLTTRYQLLQQSLQSLEQQIAVIRWWQWQQKYWKKPWRQWLVQQFQKNQGYLLSCLTHFYQQIQNHGDLLSQATYRQQVQTVLETIQLLANSDSVAHRQAQLTSLLERLSALLRKKAIEITRQKSCSPDLIHNFKRDLLAALANYAQHYSNQGEALPTARLSDIEYMRGLLNSSKDVIQMREEIIQRYQIIQSAWPIKLITSLDRSFLLRSLQNVLKNPKYSMDQLTLANNNILSLPQTPTTSQKGNESKRSLSNDVRFFQNLSFAEPKNTADARFCL